jgi:hypothetical protein
MKDTTLTRALKRAVWLVLAGALTALLGYLTSDWSNAAWYPLVYFVLKTAADFVNRSVPNR